MISFTSIALLVSLTNGLDEPSTCVGEKRIQIGSTLKSVSDCVSYVNGELCSSQLYKYNAKTSFNRRMITKYLVVVEDICEKRVIGQYEVTVPEIKNTVFNGKLCFASLSAAEDEDARSLLAVCTQESDAWRSLLDPLRIP